MWDRLKSLWAKFWAGVVADDPRPEPRYIPLSERPVADPLPGGFVRKGGHNSPNSQVKVRPPGPAPLTCLTAAASHSPPANERRVPRYPDPEPIVGKLKNVD